MKICPIWNVLTAERESQSLAESKVAETAEKYGLDAYAQIPVNPEIAKLCDAGKIEELDKNWLENIVKKLEA